jgi:hypothetical protein
MKGRENLQDTDVQMGNIKMSSKQIFTVQRQTAVNTVMNLRNRENQGIFKP